MEESRYALDILRPDSDELWVRFESTTPFMAITAGDTIDPNLWEVPMTPASRVRVMRVRHALWVSEDQVRIRFGHDASAGVGHTDARPA